MHILPFPSLCSPYYSYLPTGLLIFVLQMSAHEYSRISNIYYVCNVCSQCNNVTYMQ